MIQWPPAASFAENLDTNISYWTIHGLWPSRIKTPETYPCTCSADEFDRRQVLTIENELNTFWPSVSGPNPLFWKHEWEKHGTCATSYLKTQFKYFSTTLRLYNSLKIDNVFKHFEPSNSHPFSYDVLSQAITKKYNKKAILRCSKNHRLAYQYLQEVMFCFALSSFPRHFSCPESILNSPFTSTCNKNEPILIIPPPREGATSQTMKNIIDHKHIFDV